MENGDAVLAAMPKDQADSVGEASVPSSSADCGKKSIEESPLLIFLLFHKAVRSELDLLNAEAVALATGAGGDFKSLSERFRFLFSVYKHHCNAEDEVGFLIKFYRFRCHLLVSLG